jgi:hypothetical protein
MSQAKLLRCLVHPGNSAVRMVLPRASCAPMESSRSTLLRLRAKFVGWGTGLFRTARRFALLAQKESMAMKIQREFARIVRLPSTKMIALKHNAKTVLQVTSLQGRDQRNAWSPKRPIF